MFKSNYYKRRYVYELENGYKAMIELNNARREYYVFLPEPEITDDYAIYLRKYETKPINPEKLESLGGLLEKHGFSDIDFINPFGRTKKIVKVLDIINKLEKEEVKTKIK